MAVTVDISNVTDIHPRNKQDVGKRLALWALAHTYGREGIEYSGPLFKSAEVEGDKIRISFDHVGGGLVSRDGQSLTHFTIAGADGTFVDAQAEIDGETVVVHADSVKEPQHVRFGWHEEAEPNLSNQEGLPASPFRTDK
jgi:sialate O-acetylesterase